MSQLSHLFGREERARTGLGWGKSEVPVAHGRRAVGLDQVVAEWRQTFASWWLIGVLGDWPEQCLGHRSKMEGH